VKKLLTGRITGQPESLIRYFRLVSFDLSVLTGASHCFASYRRRPVRPLNAAGWIASPQDSLCEETASLARSPLHEVQVRIVGYGAFALDDFRESFGQGGY
jgi:hypothetical protein